MRWGMTEYEAKEKNRPEFDNNVTVTQRIESPITGNKEPTFPKEEQKKRLMFSATIVFLFMVYILLAYTRAYSLT
jgi:hypothetical protein